MRVTLPALLLAGAAFSNATPDGTDVTAAASATPTPTGFPPWLKPPGPKFCTKWLKRFSASTCSSTASIWCSSWASQTQTPTVTSSTTVKVTVTTATNTVTQTADCVSTTTIITSVPTKLVTSVPTALVTSVPTKLVTSVPTNLITSIPTTFVTSVPTTTITITNTITSSAAAVTSDCPNFSQPHKRDLRGAPQCIGISSRSACMCAGYFPTAFASNTQTIVSTVTSTAKTSAVTTTTTTPVCETPATSIVIPSTATSVVIPSTITSVVIPSTVTSIVIPSTITSVIVPSTITSTVVPSTVTSTATLTKTVFTTPTVYNNPRGLVYQSYTNPFHYNPLAYLDLDIPYRAFDPTYFKSATVQSSGVASSPADSLIIPSYTTYQYKGYLYAETTGTYTFTMSAVKNIAFIWTGSTALSGFNRNNALCWTTLGLGSFCTGQVYLNAGDYLPVRFMVASADLPGTWLPVVLDPSLFPIFGKLSGPSQGIIQQSCKSSGAPGFT